MFHTRIKAIIQNCLWLVCFPVRGQGSKPWQHNQNQSSPHCRAQWFRFLLYFVTCQCETFVSLLNIEMKKGAGNKSRGIVLLKRALCLLYMHSFNSLFNYCNNNSLFLTPVLPNQIFSSCIVWAHARRACSSLWIRMGSPPESPAGKLFVPPPQPACLVPTARRWSKGSHLEAHRGPAALYKVTQSSVSARLYSLNSICSFSSTACAPSLKSGWA